MEEEYPATHFSHKLFNCTAYLPYYTRKHKVTKELDENGGIIYAFEDGDNPKTFAEIISKAFLDDDKFQPLEDGTFCVIPVSKQVRTLRRFKSFCKEMYLLMGTPNGYDLISNLKGREEIHKLDDKSGLDIIERLRRARIGQRS